MTTYGLYEKKVRAERERLREERQQDHYNRRRAAAKDRGWSLAVFFAAELHPRRFRMPAVRRICDAVLLHSFAYRLHVEVWWRGEVVLGASRERWECQC